MNKLCAADFAVEAIRNSGSTAERLKRLRARLDEHEGFDVSECLGAVRRLVTFARSPNLSAPPADERRVRWACSPSAMVALNCTALELMALAAVEATQRFPQVFGPGVRGNRRPRLRNALKPA